MKTTIDVTQDLTAIIELADDLLTEAVIKAGDPLMPGGLAMVALAPVASPDEWAETLEAAEHRAQAKELDLPAVEDDDDWEPPLQTLLFWSESWRVEHGYPLSAKPTLASEANFIRWALEWAWENEVHWEDFARDVSKARTRLESIEKAGVRPAFRGAPCLYDECRGKRLIRKTVPCRDENGEKSWRLTDWHCPNCKRQWSEEDYARNVYAAVERTHWLNLNDEAWCTYDRAARHVERPEGTIRSWVSRGEVSVMCSVDTRRTFVLLVDVEARAVEAHARWLRMVWLHPADCKCGQHSDVA